MTEVDQTAVDDQLKLTVSFGPLVSIMMVCYRELKLNNQANKTHQNTAITRKAFYSDYMATL